jgi:hypothetical protein
MAPCRVERPLALTLQTPRERRTPPDFRRVEGAHPTHGFREPLRPGPARGGHFFVARSWCDTDMGTGSDD